MRDLRFVAVHRGGPLEMKNHRLLVRWSADCAEHVLSLFTEHTDEDRPQNAIAQARAWVDGKISVGEARDAAFAAHASAREVKECPAAVAVARAAGHAVAVAHMADHCLKAAVYAIKAIKAANRSAEIEREWQIEQLPKEVKDLVLSALKPI